MIIFVILDQRKSQKLRADFEREEAEYHRRAAEKEKAQVDKVNAERLKALMKANPTWTQHDAEIHILAEDYDARHAAQDRCDSDKSMDDIARGCGIIYAATRDKAIGSLTIEQARQIQACEALGFYH